MNDADLKQRFGTFGQTETRTFAAETRISGAGADGYQIIGYGSVYDSPSVEMLSPFGSFIERISPGAFSSVLASNPDVLLTIDHDPGRTLARTKSGTLELRTDPKGLRFWGRAGDTTYARDLRVMMDRGDIDGASFKFSVAPGGEDWNISDDGVVQRTITRVGALYDVCVTALGAYPDARAELMRTRALEFAYSRGFLAKDPATEARLARARIELELRRRRVGIAD